MENASLRLVIGLALVALTYSDIAHEGWLPPQGAPRDCGVMAMWDDGSVSEGRLIRKMLWRWGEWKESACGAGDAAQMYVPGDTYISAQLPFLGFARSFDQVGQVNRGLMQLAVLSPEEGAADGSSDSKYRGPSDEGASETDHSVSFAFKIILLLVIGIVCIWKGIMISIFCTKSRNWGPFSLGFLVIGFCSLIYAALLVSPGH